MGSAHGFSRNRRSCLFYDDTRWTRYRRNDSTDGSVNVGDGRRTSETTAAAIQTNATIKPTYEPEQLAKRYVRPCAVMKKRRIRAAGFPPFQYFLFRSSMSLSVFAAFSVKNVKSRLISDNVSSSFCFRKSERW